MPSITTVVNFDMPTESVNEFLTEWRKNNAFMQDQPGQTGGAFYRSLDHDTQARFVNVAHWDNKESMTTARQASEKWRQRTGLDFGEIFSRLGVTVVAGTFEEELRY